MQYRVARGVVQLPTPVAADGKRPLVTKAVFVQQGELLPEGVMSPAELASALKYGILVPAAGNESLARAIVKPPSRWTLDPTTLRDKALEELLVMIYDLDPKADLTSYLSVDAALAQLTADFDPTAPRKAEHAQAGEVAERARVASRKLAERKTSL